MRAPLRPPRRRPGSAVVSADGLLVDQRRLDAPARVRHVGEAELREDRADVTLDGTRGHLQLLSDRRIAATRSEQDEHFALALAQRLQALVSSRLLTAHHRRQHLYVDVRLAGG